MSYYSDITIEMTETDYKELGRRLAACKWSALEWTDIFKREDVDENIITMCWKNIKWYDEESIDIIQDFIKQVPCHYIRIGEETSDTEEIFNMDWDYFYDSETEVKRKINILDAGTLIQKSKQYDNLRM